MPDRLRRQEARAELLEDLKRVAERLRAAA
jgi:hypothetical protein